VNFWYWLVFAVLFIVCVIQAFALLKSKERASCRLESLRDDVEDCAKKLLKLCDMLEKKILAKVERRGPVAERHWGKFECLKKLFAVDKGTKQ